MTAHAPRLPSLPTAGSSPRRIALITITWVFLTCLVLGWAFAPFLFEEKYYFRDNASYWDGTAWSLTQDPVMGYYVTSRWSTKPEV